MANAGPLIILVKPDPGTDPEVHLSQREVSVSGATKIRWEKDPDCENFRFIGFVPIKEFDEDFVNPFKKIKINKNRIKCKFKNAVTGPDYKYTIAIAYSGKALNSDIKDPNGPSHGRAVIRN